MKADAWSCRLAKSWHDIVRDGEQERNPLRIRALAHELNEAILLWSERKSSKTAFLSCLPPSLMLFP
jgi:hypothetical protein